MHSMIAQMSAVIDHFTQFGYNRTTTIRKEIKNVGKVRVAVMCERKPRPFQ